VTLICCVIVLAVVLLGMHDQSSHQSNQHHFLFSETRRIQESSPVSTRASSQDFENLDSENLQASFSHKDESTLEGAVVVDEFLRRGRPSGSQFKIFQAIDRRAIATIFHRNVTHVEIFFFPTVFWAAMTLDAVANSLLDVNLTQSQFFLLPLP
jgi:hypothetical protein